jgi:FAD/FMN-containing dehydrogenase
MTDIIAALKAIIGERYVFTEASDLAPHLMEWRGLWTGKAQAVVKPSTADEVSAVMKLSAATGTPIVTQGGNTGGVGGQTPDHSGRAVILSTARLNRFRSVNPLSGAITVEAGVTLQQVQDKADEVDRLFPLSLASEGSCTIGGNLATNAGGTGVIAYGNMRDLVLGLEVVLADGRIWNGLSELRKDNTGYEMKHLFIGSEGTLGVITAATLKLFPKPKARVTAFAGLTSPEDALALLNRAQAGAEGVLTTFELLPRLGIEMVTANTPGTRDPLASIHPWYALLEVSGQDATRLHDGLEMMLGAAIEAGEVEDAVLAASLDQRAMLWKLREDLPTAQGFEGGSIKHDISVPVADVPAFMREALAMLEARFPGCRPCPFGHMGDGNLHFNVTQPKGANKAAYLALYEEMNLAVYEIVARFSGSIAAEHGVGQMKRTLLPRFKDKVAMELMRTMKAALDPQGLLNPGKVL